MHEPCPRCGGPVPNAEHEGEYPGALSRTDNETEVCSKCGQDEALEDFFGDGLTSQADWPVSGFQQVTNAIAAMGPKTQAIMTKAIEEAGPQMEVLTKAKGIKHEQEPSP